MTIKLSRGFTLPDEFVTMKVGIIGRTGSGKTNTATVLAEKMIPLGLPVVIIDPQGDWWGLRSDYEIAILGGEHADVPLEPTGGEIAADFVINERVPVLLDLFRMGEAEMVRFAAEFAKRLWQSNREALHVFLDEADLFAPQSGMKGPKAQCLGAWQNVCRRGRSRGIGLTMITQRPAVINKDLLTQADPLFVHRLTAPQDLSAVDGYLSFHGIEKPERRKLTAQIAKSQQGEAVVLSPGELEIEPTSIKVRKRKSFDSSATPQAGERVTEPKTMADVDLSALTTAMADAIERKKQTDPKELQQRINELEQELASRPVEVDQAAIDRAVAEREREWQESFTNLQEQSDRFRQQLAHGQASLTEVALSLDVDGEPTVDRPAAAVASPQRTRPAASRSVARSTPPRDAPAVGEFGNLSKCERAILRAFYWLKNETADKAKIAFYSGYSAKSSGFNNALGSLRTAGLVDGWQITPAGFDLIPREVLPKPSGAELREWLRQKLSKAENAILDALIEAGGRRLDKTEISEASGYSETSSGFNNALGKLRTIEAAEGYDRDGGTKAADVFFE